jgi:hypothetical protein
VPDHVELKEFEELSEAIKTYNPEEDAKMDQDIQEVQSDIAEVF